MSVHAGWIWAVALWVVGDVAILAAEQGAPPIPPAASLGTGLLLEPPLDLSAYTREQFIAQSSTVGTNRIGKAWTKPVLPLPPHPRPGVKGLTEAEVKEYMLAAREAFEAMTRRLEDLARRRREQGRERGAPRTGQVLVDSQERAAEAPQPLDEGTQPSQATP